MFPCLGSPTTWARNPPNLPSELYRKVLEFMTCLEETGITGEFLIRHLSEGLKCAVREDRVEELVRMCSLKQFVHRGFFLPMVTLASQAGAALAKRLSLSPARGFARNTPQLERLCPLLRRSEQA